MYCPKLLLRRMWMCNNHSKVFSSTATARRVTLPCTVGTPSKQFPGRMTLSPRVGGKSPGTGARAVTPGECCPGRAGPARATRPLWHLAAVPAGAAARLTPAALGLVSPALSGCGVSFPSFSPKRGCLPGAAVTRVAARSAPSGNRQAA